MPPRQGYKRCASWPRVLDAFRAWKLRSKPSDIEEVHHYVLWMTRFGSIAIALALALSLAVLPAMLWYPENFFLDLRAAGGPRLSMPGGRLGTALAMLSWAAAVALLIGVFGWFGRALQRFDPHAPATERPLLVAATLLTMSHISSTLWALFDGTWPLLQPVLAIWGIWALVVCLRKSPAGRAGEAEASPTP